jgi:S1-C subfamily serine protease
MEQPATHAGSVSEGAADKEHLKEQLRVKGVPQETISAETSAIRFPPRREELPSVPPAKKPRTFGLPAELASPRPRGLTRASSSARRREICKTNERSVVIIQAAQLPQQFLMPQQFPICQGQVPRELSKGSGFVWDDEGHVVTNYHVIAKAQLATVTINVGGGELKEYHANLCGADPENDIAVLKVWAPRSVLKPITCGSSSEVSKGDTVFTIGHPYGFDFFFTQGMVNAVGDNEFSIPNSIIKGCIVSNSDIGPGSSGGPLLDENGHLVGLNFAHMVKNNSISLSVPLDTVRRFVNSWPLAPIARSPELKANHNPIHKYRNALAAAKRALTEIRETSDDASVRAASGLAEISEALEGEDLPGIRLAVALGAR